MRAADGIAGMMVGLVLVSACKSEGPALAPADPPRAASSSPEASSPATTAVDASANGDAGVPVDASVASSSPSATATIEPDRCRTDDECVLTTFASCCACCPCGPLHATTKTFDKAQRAACNKGECGGCKDARNCAPCVDPKKEGMRARCVEFVCTLVETSSKAR